MEQSREQSAKKFVVFVNENWKQARPFILCNRSFLEEHFLLQQLDNPISEFTRQQYHKWNSQGQEVDPLSALRPRRGRWEIVFNLVLLRVMSCFPFNLGMRPDVMASNLDDINEYYQISYRDRYPDGTHRCAYADMVENFPSFISKWTVNLQRTTLSSKKANLPNVTQV